MKNENEEKRQAPGTSGPMDEGRKHDSVGLSRRRFALASLSIPAIAVLANRPAFGAMTTACNPSGYISFHADNVSGAHHVDGNGCGGWSPGSWKNPYAGNGDGSYRDWRNAQSYPHHPDGTLSLGGGNNFGAVRDDFTTVALYEPTLFKDALDYGSDSLTLHEAMLGSSGSLEFHAAAAYLNASLNEATEAFPGYMNVQDVRAVYRSAKTNTLQITSGGNEILFTESQAQAFFVQTYH